MGGDWPLARLIALSLIVGGGLGNLIDRLLNHGVVVDYISMGVGSLRTGVFNLADAAITVGLVVILVSQSQRCAR